MDINKFDKILKCLPHRFPFLLIDKILENVPNISITTLKNISSNDFFLGHFPKKLVYPGVLILESIAQSCGLFCALNNQKLLKNELYYLSNIQNSKFKKLVLPGDQLIIKIILKNYIFPAYKFFGTVLIQDVLICSATLTLIKKNLN
ncbi:3-hydroxyacyl-ACP dehydratase FabZ [Buchnera aphidicola]|uniref:3-hydroxyacyl-[acyl-carrier-protein] dehydratase FabZ n=1 Tax=Buchnera aphidicola subsp. Tuberolachnus salignus TaxID=98804 RepID=A0A160SYY5_BUCTT|nr:3-hydroxyacyl-ACP dehydratase FabZ [Buchnera aphidicola]CUR53136.1 3-hydroxyacyl-[acyl-carrier-protein] dehydratase FabZ [Buchnera aphidicola (Tuberolachnus salignus)]